jgi:hypothetical protein
VGTQPLSQGWNSQYVVLTTHPLVVPRLICLATNGSGQ